VVFILSVNILYLVFKDVFIFLGETIGTGHYAVVKLARHVFTQKEVAVKVIDKMKLDEISKAHLFQEVMCMKLVQHPNVVRLYEVIDTPNKLYLILEFADGGDMYDYIMKHANGLNESLARRYFQQICRALKYCHEMHVCHRDLKVKKWGIIRLIDVFFFCSSRKI
jgi:SNF-related kinase